MSEGKVTHLSRYVAAFGCAFKPFVLVRFLAFWINECGCTWAL